MFALGVTCRQPANRHSLASIKPLKTLHFECVQRHANFQASVAAFLPHKMLLVAEDTDWQQQRKEAEAGFSEHVQEQLGGL